jgi:phage gp16-like protein
MKAYTRSESDTEAIRQKLMRTVRVGCSDLGIDEDTRKSMLLTLTRKDSLKELDVFNLRKVVSHLVNQGFKIMRPTPKEDWGTQEAKLLQLWVELKVAKKIDDGSESALAKWIENQTRVINGGVGISHPKMLSGRMAQRLIERLKKWLDRP